MSDFFSNQPYREPVFMPKLQPTDPEEPPTDLPPTAALEELEARLTGRIADLEARLNGELSAVRSGCGKMWGRIDALEGELRAALPQVREEQRADAERQDLFREVWEGAALTVRLAFEQVALAREHLLQGALREAAALVDLWRKGAELEGWVTGYPVLFLEAWEKLSPPGEPGSGAVERLSRETLAEVRALLDDTLRARGIEWVSPRPGEPVTEAHTVAGEATAPGVAAGRVARCARPGLRRGGTLLLPAQVYRQAAGAPVLETPQPQELFAAPDHATPPVAPVATPDPPPPTPAAPQEATRGEADRPEWLGELERRGAWAAGPHVPVTEALRLLSTPEAPALSDAALRSVLPPLLPALSPGRGVLLEGAPEAWRETWEAALPELASWLEKRAKLELVAPEERAPFVLEQMEATETRRTAHPHEENTVARLQQVGVLREGRVLFPARVVRYEVGVGR